MLRRNFVEANAIRLYYNPSCLGIDGKMIPCANDYNINALVRANIYYNTLTYITGTFVW